MMEATLELPPLDFGEEVSKLVNVTHQNTKVFLQIAQNIIKSTVEESKESKELGELDNAILSLREAREVIDSLNLDMKQKQGKIVALNKDAHEMKNKVSLAAKSCREHSALAVEKELELKELASALSEKSDIDEQKRVKITSELEKWKRILGLELVNSSHGGITFVFTNIDEENPDKQFSCEVGIYNQQFQIAHCIPMVVGLENLGKLLNSTKDLSGFVVSLRQKFRAVDMQVDYNCYI